MYVVRAPEYCARFCDLRMKNEDVLSLELLSHHAISLM